jgi:hypothetical protein
LQLTHFSAKKCATAVAPAVIADAEPARDEPAGRRRRTLARLRRELRRIKSRDYFPPPERERAEQAVEALATLVEERVA